METKLTGVGNMGRHQGEGCQNATPHPMAENGITKSSFPEPMQYAPMAEVMMHVPNPAMPRV